MQRRLQRLEEGTFDVAVIGGGIFGACAAWEAASRGLSVALVEQADFGGATSANSFKIVHGGVRYLQHLDLPRVRSSSEERGSLLRIAPHLVTPLPIVIPTYGMGMQGRLPLKLAFGFYDLITAGRNRGIRDPARRVPPAATLSRADVLHEFPGVDAEGLTGGLIFCEGQMYNPPRLTFAFLGAAAEQGAVLANYAEVTGFRREGATVTGIEVLDRERGTTHEVRARTVLNAAGPWATRLVTDLAGLDWPGEPPGFSRDIGLVVRRPPPSRLGLARTTGTRDREAVGDRGGRHLFLLPWRGHTLVGVWHGVWNGPADTVEVRPDELVRLVAEANEAFPGLELVLDEVAHVITGLILFGESREGGEGFKFGHRSVLVDHAREHEVDGLVTLIGVRATMARAEAEEAVDLLARKLGRRLPPSRTASLPILGGDLDGTFEDLVASVPSEAAGLARPEVRRALAHNHGTRYPQVLAHGADDAGLLETVGESTVLRAEVVHACRHEMARTLQDVVLRRTDLATAVAPTRDSLVDVAALIAAELGWGPERVEVELADMDEFLERRGALRRFTAAPGQPAAP